jgi:hypothetical protein
MKLRLHAVERENNDMITNKAEKTIGNEILKYREQKRLV